MLEKKNSKGFFLLLQNSEKKINKIKLQLMTSVDSLLFQGFINPNQHQEQQQSESSSSNNKQLFIKDIDWSIDVVLATNTVQQPSANGVPIVNLTLTLSDDSVIQRRLTTSELHKWRYTLARATKDLQTISSRQPPPETAAGSGSGGKKGKK
jgi:hypothetical protein